MTFKIEMTKKKAEVIYSDESSLTGSFFTSIQTPGHEGNESISDLLVSENKYLPFELDEGKTALLQKECIVMVVLDDPEMKRGITYQQNIPVKVHFLSGKIIEGKVYSDLPASNSRLSDFLNQSKAFFYLDVGDKDYLVNSRFIKIVCPVPSD